jgi:hypothetical protein
MSDSKRIESEIVQLEAALAPIATELDSLYAQFGKALVPAVEAWMRKSVRRRIEENAQKINAGGLELMKQIKAELAALVARLPEICIEAIGMPDQWPHRRNPSSSSDQDVTSRESYSAGSFRRAINHLGPLLAKHGLIDEKIGYVAEWERTGNGFRYAINPGFDERQFPVLQEYQKKRQEQRQQLEQLFAKRTELEKARVRELWDEA